MGYGGIGGNDSRKPAISITRENVGGGFSDPGVLSRDAAKQLEPFVEEIGAKLHDFLNGSE